MDRLQKLFLEVYIKNCEIENVKPEEDDLEKIKLMERDKLYKNFKYFINNLLDFKNKVKNSNVKEMAQRTIELETIITKLEAKNRAFIAGHFQSKVEIESLQKKIDELNNQADKDSLEKSKLKSKVSELSSLLAKTKENRDSYKKFIDPDKRIVLNLDQITRNPKSMTLKAVGKVLSDRRVEKSTGKILKSKSVVNIQDPPHSRSKSESSNVLKIIIP